MLSITEKLLKFGKRGEPIPVTQLLQLPIEHPLPARALLFINKKAGTYIAANVYRDKKLGWRLGASFDPALVVRPLPSVNDKRWEEWEDRGYRMAKVSQFDVAKMNR